MLANSGKLLARETNMISFTKHHQLEEQPNTSGTAFSRGFFIFLAPFVHEVSRGDKKKRHTTKYRQRVGT
jgi:hypothetical protein